MASHSMCLLLMVNTRIKLLLKTSSMRPKFWKSAIGGTKDSKLSWKNTKQSGTDTMISADDAKAVVAADPAFAAGNAIDDQKAYRWEYVDQSKE